METFQTLSTKLKEMNGAVVAAYIALERDRADRNGILYQPLTGLVDRASDTISYIKSVYGTTSPEYKQVGSIQFKTRLIN